MAITNPNSALKWSVRVRIATLEDAERIRIVINSAFRPAEGFFVEDDRIDAKTILHLLATGKFLVAESEPLVLGSVYVEPHPILVSDGSRAPLDLTPDDRGKDDYDLAGEIRSSQSEIGDPESTRAYLGLLAVDPAHQHSGLGTVLMEAAEAHCRALGADFMDIKVVSLREELVGYYRRRGYVETGTSPFPAEVVTKLPCHFIEMSKPLNNDPRNHSKHHKVD